MVAERARRVEISGIRRMFESAPPNSINLGLGEPDFDPPPEVIAALCQAVRTGGNHYGPSAGLSALRDQIAARYTDRDPRTVRENVIVTASGSEGLMTTALTLYDPGDEVLVPNPGFVLYGPHARLAGAVPVPYPLLEKRQYQPDLNALERLVTPKTRAIVVNSPSNPTGSLLPESTVERIVEFADRHHLAIVSDEVYEEIVYEGRFSSFWGKYDRTVVVNSFSKTFAVTGWRLGFLVAAKPLAIELNKIHYHIMACPPTPAQTAILAGFEAGNAATRAMVREFKARRSLLLRLLRTIPGVTLVPPAGAFYAFPKVDWGLTATEAATAILARGVITTPGDAFGSLGASHLRLSFAASREKLRLGLGIIRAFAEERVDR
ncbi:MAG: pyridoxal phosphate-dependent aminotransferase [Thermoplasmata archaeon]|nr:pyridoxal phosphate-dependent aminotransferase [Thermoplasmata archaeon]